MHPFCEDLVTGDFEDDEIWSVLDINFTFSISKLCLCNKENQIVRS